MNNKKGKGVTLIELLAVILILGIIALIAVPTVNDVILEAKKNSLKDSASSITKAAEDQCHFEKMDGTSITQNYTIANGKTSKPIDIKNLPESGTITVDDECNATAAIVDNDFCAIKNGDKTTINSNVYNCSLEHLNVEPTKDSCFVFDENTKTITGYNYSDDTCPSDIVIPNEINEVPVENIGDFAFTVKPSGYIPLYNMYKENKPRYFWDNVKENADVIDLEIYAIEFIKINDKTTKKCASNDKKDEIKDLNYHVASNDSYIGCYLENYDVLSTTGSITSVDFTKANNLKTIGDGAFMNNKITNVYFDLNNTFSHLGVSIFNNNLIKKLDLRGLNYNIIPNSMFIQNSISKVSFSNNIKIISKGAFAHNNIEEYNFPSSLVKIGPSAFSYNNVEVNNVTLPDSLEEIGAYAFKSNNIKNLKLGNNLKKVYYFAFYDANLYNVEFNSQLEYIGSLAFANNNLSKIKLKSTLKHLDTGAFNLNKVVNESDGMYFTSVKNGIADPTTLLSVAAKEGLNLKIPEGIVTILPGTLISINFKSILTPKSLKKIDAYSISYNYVKGATVELSSSVTTIERNAFYCPDANSCQMYIKINKPENSIPGYENKWGNPYANIIWNYKG